MNDIYPIINYILKYDNMLKFKIVFICNNIFILLFFTYLIK